MEAKWADQSGIAAAVDSLGRAVDGFTDLPIRAKELFVRALVKLAPDLIYDLTISRPLTSGRAEILTRAEVPKFLAAIGKVMTEINNNHSSPLPAGEEKQAADKLR